MTLAALRVADLLALGAAPAFAFMAVLTHVLQGGTHQALCSPAPASPLSGMAAMYLLMSAIHTAPWLQIIARCRRGAQAS